MNPYSYPLLTSLQNPKIKQTIALRERRERDKTAAFIIEGYREILRAQQAGIKLNTLFICPELFLGVNEAELIQRAEINGASIYQCTQQVMHKLSYRDRPDGLVAIAPQIRLALSDLERILENKPNPFLVIAESIEKPGNLGTILRCSDAVGIDALIVCDKCTDIFNPNVVRASVGTLFTVPVIETSSKKLIPYLKQRGIAIIATTPAATEEYTEVSMKQGIAIAMGTEQVGLTGQWLQQADINIKIPMLGVADSLNVAMATTIVLYEALRQRKDFAK